MRGRRIAVLLLGILMLPAAGLAQPACAEPVLSDQQVKNIVEREKATRTDLPAPFADYRSVVSRHGCHYVYIEYGLPEAFHKEHIFKLNQRGVLVDVESGGDPTQSMKCPAKVLTEGELAEIVRKTRAERRDLPTVFPRYRTHIGRLRCLYLYSEYAQPEAPGRHHVFVIDPFGEVLDVVRAQP
jgi:hypothetical protein